MGSQAIRVLIVDDHALVRELLIRAISEEADMMVVGEAEDGLQGLELAHGLDPDVVVMDAQMPRLNGVEATERMVRELPRVRVVGLSYDDSAWIRDAMLAAGARAFVSKTESLENLVGTIRAALPDS